MRRWCSIFGCLCVVLLSAVSARGQGAVVYLPEDTEIDVRIEGIEDLVSSGRWVSAARMVHGLLVEHGEDLARVEAGLLRGVPEVVWSGVGASDELRRAYRRLYGTRAEAALAGVEPGLGGRAALERIRRVYRPTAASAEASLRLTAMHLEAGRLLEAGRELARVRGDLVEPAMMSRHERLVDALDRLLLFEPLVATPAGVGGDRGRWGPSPGVIGPMEGTPLWSLSWSSLTGGALEAGNEQERARRLQMLHQGLLVLPDPVLSGDMVFVNTGRFVVGLDRFSGGMRWRVKAEEVEPVAAVVGNQRVVIGRRRPLLPAGLSVGGDRVFAVLGGNGLGGDPRAAAVAGGRQLVCVGREAGVVLWSAGAEVFGDASVTGQVAGDPLVLGDRVVVQLIRLQAGTLSEIEIVCLSAETGALLWRRFVGTVGVGRVGMPRFQADLGLTHGGERLVVVHGAGLVAVLDPEDGTLGWVTSLGDRADGGAADVRSGRPSAGLRSGSIWSTLPGAVLVLSGGERRLRVLDPERGRLLDREVPEGFGEGVTAMIQLDDGRVLSVGRGYQVLDESLGVERSWGSDPREAAGEGDARQGLWLLHQQGLVWVDVEAGRVERWGDVAELVRWAAHPEQLLLAKPEGLSAYMAWPLARARLIESIEGGGADPSVALRLAEVALGQGDREAVALGLSSTSAALGELGVALLPDEQRVDLVDRLVRLGLSSPWSGGEISGVLQGMLELLVESPSERAVTALLRAEDLSASGEVVEAVGVYQSVLLDGTLSSAVVSWLGPGTRAGRRAAEEVRVLVSVHGQGVYAAFDDRALLELEAARDRHDAEALAQIAVRYPGSRWIRPAFELAGDLAAGRGRVLEATLYLRQAYRFAETGSEARSLVERLIGVYEDAGMARRALAWVRRFERDYPDEVLVLDSSSLTGAGGALVSDVAWGRLDGGGWTSTKQVMMPSRGSEVIVLHAGQGVTLMRQAAGEAEPVTVADRALNPPILPTVSDERDVLVMQLNPPSLRCLDRATGEERWLREDVFEAGKVEAGAGVIQGQVNPLLRQQIFVRPGRGGSRVTGAWFSDFRLVVMGQQGEVAGLDRETGETVWTHRVAGSVLRGVSVSEWVVALQRQRRDPSGAVRWDVEVLDTLTGEVLHEGLSSNVPVFKVELTGTDQLVVLRQDGVMAYSVPEGVLLWHYRPEGEVFSAPFWVEDGYVALQSNKGILHVVDVDDGGVLLTAMSATRRNEALSPIRVSGDVVYVRWGGMLAALDRGGRVLWRNAAGPIGQQLRAHWLTRDRLLVWADPFEEAVLRERPHLLSYDRRTGRLLGVRPLEPSWRQVNLSMSGLSAGGLVLNLRGHGTAVLSGAADGEDLEEAGMGDDGLGGLPDRGMLP
ncbi:outer membrane protein assembly factor BamB family protein [Mucisphaera calidilacus]|nr:PQQ-binding-like beta-propeller repeat protein [Mucisphaera calidilacus]